MLKNSIIFLLLVYTTFIRISEGSVGEIDQCPNVPAAEKFDLKKLKGNYLQLGWFSIKNIGEPNSGNFTGLRNHQSYGKCAADSIPEPLNATCIEFPMISGDAVWTFNDSQVGKAWRHGFGAYNETIQGFPTQDFFLTVLYQDDDFVIIMHCDPVYPLYSDTGNLVYILQKVTSKATVDIWTTILSREGIEPNYFVYMCDPSGTIQ